MVGSTGDPKDGAAVAGTIFTAVFVYMVGVKLLMFIINICAYCVD
jgi:hypothetical protein